MVPQHQRRRRRRAALARTSERRLMVARGAGGFGFTIAGQRPCVVSAVATGGPAERAGLRAGDAILAVDGANVARAPHASVARLVAGAPDAISLSVAPREAPPTDTEDTESDERARTRRRHPPPRRRPQPAVQHHPGCHAAPSTSGVSEILQNLSRAQLSPNFMARLECRTVVGYLGTIETPQANNNSAPGNVKNAMRKLRQERRPATPVLLSVLPNALFLRRPTGQVLAQYQRERIVYAGCGSEADRRYFGLVTAADSSDNEAGLSHSCHVFAVDPRMAEHEAHITKAREFQIACTRDPVAERCLEFPPSAEYVVGVIRGMYSLPADDCSSPVLQQISKLAVKGDSPAIGNFARRNQAVFRMPRERRPRQDNVRNEAQEFVANSPQPSNHSEVTTTSSNSDSGIGFHNDGRNITDRILVVDFAGHNLHQNRFRQEVPRRPIGLVGFDGDGSFLSNTTPVVDAFGGQGRPLNLDDIIPNSNDLPIRRVSPKKDEDGYNYNNIYGNIPSSSNAPPNGVYDQVYTENESSQYNFIPQNLDMDFEVDRVAETFNSVEIYEERSRHDYQSNESVENVTVISGGTSKASADTVSVYSSRSHEETRPSLQERKHLQASLDDMLMLGLRDPPPVQKDDDNFVHPASVKLKVRKKHLNLLSKTKHMLTRDKDSKSVGARVPSAQSEPDLRAESEQSSPFRRWTTGGGAGSSYRHNVYSKMSEGAAPAAGGVSRWALGLEHLLADAAGAAAFQHFLRKEFASENIRFWFLCEQYKKCAEEEARARLADDVWERHLADGAAEPVNVDACARRAAALRRRLRPPPADLFLQAQKQIFNVMKFDSYPRFLRSAEHAECARAELRGQPPPYGPPSPAQPASAPSSLKKSASNASERRRSGASLLPWRRAASRERPPAPAPAPAAPPAPPAPPADLVKSACALCRVVLPDGATSVLGVGAGSVRALVERQLQRRNLAYSAFDVLLQPDHQTEAVPVDLAAPASALRGQLVRVEPRCVVRLQLGARCVAVRCRPARRLRHVLRPVLRRYSPRAPAAPAPAVSVLRDNVVLSPDTTMQELDGATLVVVELADYRAGAQADRDSDSHSDGEGTLRLLEERADGGSGGSAGSAGSGGSAGSAGSGGSESSRVRAALRPGAPLHCHPPDFLENLREKQRLLLHQGGKPPRSPPPLPPKPAPRATPTPTLV